MILARDSDQEELAITLRLFNRLYNHRFARPVIIFHENISKAQQENLRASIPIPTRHLISFEQIAFCLPPFLTRSVPERDQSAWNRPIGYRHMIRFYSGMLFAHPALEAFDFMW